MSQLAIPKIFYTLHMSNWIKTTVALETKFDRLPEKIAKTIVHLDWKIIDLAFVMLIEENNPNSESLNSDTAIAYAQSLTWRLKDVAIQRVILYESWQNWKMSLKKLKDRLADFIKTPAKYPSYHKLFNEWQ